MISSATCQLVFATENLTLNNSQVLHNQEPEGAALAFDFTSPRPLASNGFTNASDLSCKLHKVFSPVLFEAVDFAPLLPDMFTQEEHETYRLPVFKIQPRFAAWRTGGVSSIGSAFVNDPVSSDEDDEESAPPAAAASEKDEDSPASMSTSMESVRQEHVDTFFHHSNKSSIKISPKKKTVYMKQPVPQRPPVRMQPRRNSFGAIAA